MATSLGSLTDDQQRFVNLVSSGTGLDARVVTAWVGTESGWATTKGTHNYLNIGPGRQYASTDQAAAATVSLINTSKNYAGIRSSIAQGPSAQVAAIGSSPWGTVGATLNKVASSVLGDSNFAPTAQPASALGDALGGAASSVATTVVSAAAKAALSLVFVVGALALIGIGLSYLSRKSPREAMSGIAGVVGKVNTARSVASAAAV